MSWEVIIVAIISGAVTAFLGILTVYQKIRADRLSMVVEMKKADTAQRQADTELYQINQKSAIELITQLKENITNLRAQIDRETLSRLELTGELATAKAAMIHARVEIDGLKTVLKKTMDDLNSTIAGREDREKRIDEMENVIVSLNVRINQLEKNNVEG